MSRRLYPLEERRKVSHQIYVILITNIIRNHIGIDIHLDNVVFSRKARIDSAKF
jgi:hypothetical protein